MKKNIKLTLASVALVFAASNVAFAGHHEGDDHGKGHGKGHVAFMLGICTGQKLSAADPAIMVPMPVAGVIPAWDDATKTAVHAAAKECWDAMKKPDDDGGSAEEPAPTPVPEPTPAP